jgi:hypothetical protein
MKIQTSFLHVANCAVFQTSCLFLYAEREFLQYRYQSLKWPKELRNREISITLFTFLAVLISISLTAGFSCCLVRVRMEQGCHKLKFRLLVSLTVSANIQVDTVAVIFNASLRICAVLWLTHYTRTFNIIAM